MASIMKDELIIVLEASKPTLKSSKKRKHLSAEGKTQIMKIGGMMTERLPKNLGNCIQMKVIKYDPSESQVQKDFNRMASRRGIPISGSARVNKMHRVRVDGERKEVWSVNYDVPNADGTKTWKRSYMTYENGKPKVIRTDTQG